MGERKVTARKGCWAYISLQYQSAPSMWRGMSHAGGQKAREDNDGKGAEKGEDEEKGKGKRAGAK